MMATPSNKSKAAERYRTELSKIVEKIKAANPKEAQRMYTKIEECII